jgi:hypothetical protein
MARSGTVRKQEPLPEPLPPETRTVGQLVAETLKLYGKRPFAALALGVPFAVVEQVAVGLDRGGQFVVLSTLGAVLLSSSFVAASALVAGIRPPLASAVTAAACGALVFVPAPLLLVLFILPAVAWLAVTGLVVPAVTIEGLGVTAGFRRAYQLARADFVHALGSLATLAILFFLTRLVLFFLLRDSADSGSRAALALADVVISPVLFLGAALLYVDQAARVAAGSRDR